jgi:hypothetical protein
VLAMDEVVALGGKLDLLMLELFSELGAVQVENLQFVLKGTDY